MGGTGVFVSIIIIIAATGIWYKVLVSRFLGLVSGLGFLHVDTWVLGFRY